MTWLDIQLVSNMYFHCYGSHFSFYMSNFGVIVFSIFSDGIRTRFLCITWSENMFKTCLGEWQYHSMDPLLFSGKTFTNLWPTNWISIYSKHFLMKNIGWNLPDFEGENILNHQTSKICCSCSQKYWKILKLFY